jgi:O-antigen/teichoic acid export membrane protein
MLGWSAIICASTSVGVTMVADDFVAVILGPKWLDAAPLVGWLALNAGMASLLSGTATLLDVLGMPYIGARIQWLRFIAFTILIFAVAYISQNVITVAITRLVISTLFVPSVIFAVRHLTGVPTRDYLRAMWRPFLAAGFMALAIWALNEILPFHGVARLGLDMLVGTVSYIAAVLALWELSGRPESAEQDILTLISKVQSRIARIGVLPETAD